MILFPHSDEDKSFKVSFSSSILCHNSVEERFVFSAKKCQKITSAY